MTSYAFDAEAWVVRLAAAFRALAKVQKGEAWFKLYGEQSLDAPSAAPASAVALSHSLAKIRLF